MIFKYPLILTTLLLITNFPILMEETRGECLPNPDNYLGCKDESEDALVSEVNFSFWPTNERGEYLNNLKKVEYIVKLGENVNDNTSGYLAVYPPKELIPGNPDPTLLIWEGETTSKDHTMKFEVNFKQAKPFLGNASNILTLDLDQEEPVSFEGPYIMYNMKEPIVAIPTEDNPPLIDKIIVPIRAIKTINFELRIRDRTNSGFHDLSNIATFSVIRSGNEFADLSWIPLAESKEIEFRGDYDYIPRAVPPN